MLCKSIRLLRLDCHNFEPSSSLCRPVNFLLSPFPSQDISGECTLPTIQHTHHFPPSFNTHHPHLLQTSSLMHTSITGRKHSESTPTIHNTTHSPSALLPFYNNNDQLKLLIPPPPTHTHTSNTHTQTLAALLSTKTSSSPTTSPAVS